MEGDDLVMMLVCMLAAYYAVRFVKQNERHSLYVDI
jgi:hypothetical protein